MPGVAGPSRSIGMHVGISLRLQGNSVPFVVHSDSATASLSYERTVEGRRLAGDWARSGEGRRLDKGQSCSEGRRQYRSQLDAINMGTCNSCCAWPVRPQC